MTMPDEFLPAEAILLRDANAPDWKNATFDPVRIEGTTAHYRVRVSRNPITGTAVFEPRQVEVTPEAIGQYRMGVAMGQNGWEALLMRKVRRESEAAQS